VSVVGGRFAAFLLVYGLVLGLAYRVGPGVDDRLALASGAAAALGHLAGAAVVRRAADAGFGAGGPLVEAVVALGFSAGAGVELAVVAVAGGALGRRGAERDRGRGRD